MYGPAALLGWLFLVLLLLKTTRSALSPIFYGQMGSARTGRRSISYTVKAKSRVTVHKNVFVFEIKRGFCYKKKFTFLKDKLHYFYCMGCGLWVVAAPSAVFHLHQNVQRHRSLCPACSIAKRTIFSRSHSLAITLALSIFLPHLSSS